MLLMDAVAATAHEIANQRLDTAHSPILSAFPELARKLVGTPRFLFDNASIGTAVELTLGRPKVLREAMHPLHIPFPRLWVEWEEVGRERLRQRFDNRNDLPLPQRVGYLLECEAGRRGQITWLWTSTARDALTIGKFDCPCIAPISAYFDLDRDFPQPPYLLEGLLRANLGQLWGTNPIQLAALYNIWHTAEHKPSPWGEKYLNDIHRLGQHGINIGQAFGTGASRHVGAGDDFSHFVGVQYADVFGEYIMVWATLMLLTASRPIVERTHVTLDKLNRQRSKKRESLLYDHTKVTMHIKYRDLGPVIERGPLGYARKPPRIHMVSSYLARRGNRHWIVQPYMRGSGETIHRVTRVTP